MEDELLESRISEYGEIVNSLISEFPDRFYASQSSGFTVAYVGERDQAAVTFRDFHTAEDSLSDLESVGEVVEYLREKGERSDSSIEPVFDTIEEEEGVKVSVHSGEDEWVESSEYVDLEEMI